MRRWVLVAVTALVVTGAGVAAGTLLLDDEEPTSGPAAFTPTPLTSFDTSVLTVPRESFCDAVDARQVEAALGGEPVDATSYENGEEVTLADGVTGPIIDVAHEFGCTWTRADQSEARAWVFAPPVDAKRAAALVEAAGERLPGGRLVGDRGRHRVTEQRHARTRRTCSRGGAGEERARDQRGDQGGGGAHARTLPRSVAA